MDKLYTDLNSPAGFSGLNKLYREYKKIDPSIKRKDVQEYLNGKSTYTLHKVQANKFNRRRIIVKGPGNSIAMDTAYLTNISGANDGICYLLIIIDLYSRYLWIYPVKTMKSKEICSHIVDFFRNNIYIYNRITSDEGTEFTSKAAKAVYKQFNIIHYHVYSREIKSSIAERVIRTIKEKIYKYLTETQQLRYIDRLEDIVAVYNMTNHRGLHGNCPYNIHLLNDPHKILAFSKIMYINNTKKMKQFSSLLSLEAYVRLKNTGTTQNIFRKGYKIRNTREIFTIHKINKEHIPVTYEIQSLDSEKIKGIFYKQELIIVSKPDVFQVNILKSRKRAGKLQYYVDYINFPTSKNSWINANDLVE